MQRNRDHLKKHFPAKDEVCPDCHAEYKRKRDLVDHRKNRCRFRGGSDAYASQPMQSPSHHQPQNLPQPQYTPHGQSGFPTSRARREDLTPPQPSWSTPQGLDERAQQMFDDRRPGLEDVISNATQVEQELDEVYKAFWGGAEPDTFGEMLGEDSGFESFDYSSAPDGAKSKGPSAEGKGT